MSVEYIMVKKAEFSFDLDTRDVVNVDKDGRIFVSAHRCTNNNDEPCIAILTREQWDRLMNEFCEHKKDYCTRYGHWCGVGYVTASGTKHPGEFHLTVFDEGKDFEDKDYVQSINAKAYVVVDASLDMEHG